MPVRLEEFHFTGSAPVVEFPSTMDNANTLPFRLVIGVTGHRKLEDTKALRQTVNEVIGDILARYPETALPGSSPPSFLLSPKGPTGWLPKKCSAVKMRYSKLSCP